MLQLRRQTRGLTRNPPPTTATRARALLHRGGRIIGVDKTADGALQPIPDEYLLQLSGIQTDLSAGMLNLSTVVVQPRPREANVTLFAPATGDGMPSHGSATTRYTSNVPGVRATMLRFRPSVSSIALPGSKIGARTRHRCLTNSPLEDNLILEHEHKTYATLVTFGQQALNTLPHNHPWLPGNHDGAGAGRRLFLHCSPENVATQAAINDIGKGHWPRSNTGTRSRHWAGELFQVFNYRAIIEQVFAPLR